MRHAVWRIVGVALVAILVASCAVQPGGGGKGTTVAPPTTTAAGAWRAHRRQNAPPIVWRGQSDGRGELGYMTACWRATSPGVRAPRRCRPCRRAGRSDR